MKKITTLLLFLTIGFAALAQPNLFSKVYYYGGSQVTGNAILQDYDKGFVVAGSYNYLPMLMKTDSAGNLLWQKNYGTQYYNFGFYAITGTNDSCFAAAGMLENAAHSHQELIIMKTKNNGDTLWTKELVTGQDDFPYAITQTYDHGYIITGYTSYNGSTTPSVQIMVLKTDSAGNLQWRKNIAPYNYANYGYAVKQMPDSSYTVAAGIQTNSPWAYDAMLLNLSPAGNIVWAKKYNRSTTAGAGSSGAYDLYITPSGIMCYLVVGFNTVFMKTDFSGNIIWSQSYNAAMGCNSCTSNKMHATSDGGFIASIGDNWSGGMLKIDSAGNYQWGNNLFLIGQEAIETTDGGYLALGNGPLMGVSPQTTCDPQLGLVKMDSLGVGLICTFSNNYSTFPDTLSAASLTVTATSGGSTISIHPPVTTPQILVDSACVAFTGHVAAINTENTVLLYPNPASASISIESSSAKIQRIEIYNMVGELINTEQLSGNNMVTLNISSYVQGVYFLKITDVNNNKVNKKMVVE